MDPKIIIICIEICIGCWEVIPKYLDDLRAIEKMSKMIFSIIHIIGD
jgi:hypothetical protein